MPAAAPATLRFATRADALGIAEMSRDLIEAGLAWSWTRTRILRSLRQPDTNAIVAVEEARRMHYGETQERGIRGQASPDETQSLLEEGIGVLPLPIPKALKEPLQ